MVRDVGSLKAPLHPTGPHHILPSGLVDGVWQDWGVGGQAGPPLCWELSLVPIPTKSRSRLMMAGQAASCCQTIMAPPPRESLGAPGQTWFYCVTRDEYLHISGLCVHIYKEGRIKASTSECLGRSNESTQEDPA